jgi:hypothetical protein
VNETFVNLRRLVIERAANCCEYCGLSQIGQEATFHIDHVVPIKDGGLTTSDNLALACVSCSLRKGARQWAIDPQTQQKAPIFNPRFERWNNHFFWEDIRVVGLTSIGCATIEALQMNRPLILEIRREAIALGRHPSSQKD